MSTGARFTDLADAFFSDERILSSKEKDLLVHLLRHAETHASQGYTVEQSIAHAVGETVGRRAYEILGEDILRRLELPGDWRPLRGTVVGMPPLPPSPSPGPPGPHQSHARPYRGAPNGMAVLEQNKIETAQCIVYEEFLSPPDLVELLHSVLEREAEFEVSEVLTLGVLDRVDFNARRSRVLMSLGNQEQVLLGRLRACLPGVLEKLGGVAFEPGQIEVQITASNDGDFFRWHTDNGHAAIASRELTFVYFFHREPQAFRGGDLRIYDTRMEHGVGVPAEGYRVVIPHQNQVVFFPSRLAHEITPVECKSKAFPDSRFTVNGWIHRRPA